MFVPAVRAFPFHPILQLFQLVCVQLAWRRIVRARIVGFPWYKPENFALLRSMFDDGEKLQRTYVEWMNAAYTALERFRRDGVQVVKVDIDPVEFPRWCVERGLLLNSEARRAYANLIAARTVRYEDENQNS
jgi:hypothetical protein